jgi:hypothetical protein
MSVLPLFLALPFNTRIFITITLFILEILSLVMGDGQPTSNGISRLRTRLYPVSLVPPTKIHIKITLDDNDYG